MCGRASSARSGAAIRSLTGAVRSIARSEYRSSWNVGPGNRAPVLRRVRPREEDESMPPPPPPPTEEEAAAEAEAEAADADGSVIVIDSEDESDSQPKIKKTKPTAKGDHSDTKRGGSDNTKKDDGSSGGGPNTNSKSGGKSVAAAGAGAGKSDSKSSDSKSSDSKRSGEPAETELVMDVMRWGLIPSYAKTDSMSGQPLLINARSETVNQKSAFKRLVERNRCIIPCDGFYEWEKKSDPFGGRDRKQPFYIHLPDRSDLPATKQIIGGATPTGTGTGSGGAAATASAAAPKQQTPTPRGTDSSSAAAPSAALSKSWSCAACTVVNSAARTVCATCNTPNNERKAMAAAAAAAANATKSVGSSAAATATGSGSGNELEESQTLGDSILQSRPLMLLAGLYDRWKNPATGEWVYSYTVLTTDSNKSSDWLHDRLPLILDESAAAIWLDTERFTFADCVKFIRPFSGALIFYSVSDNVNYMRNKGFDCIEPLQSVNAKKKANGISKFFTAAAATKSTPKGGGADPNDPHSWPQAVEWWKRTEQLIAAWKKTAPSNAVNSSSAAPSLTKEQSAAAAGKRKSAGTANVSANVSPKRAPSAAATAATKK